MYNPSFKKNRENVPILSKPEIDSISERYAAEFMPEIIQNPQPFNIDGFVENYLDLQLDYQYLSNDGRYLGMTIFNDTNRVIVFLPEQKCADYVHADEGTIIIDNSLLSGNQDHRYRFTLGHEAGHWIFHRSYFGYNPNQITFFEMNIPFIQCREINRNYIGIDSLNWDNERWMEWQADKFSAGILMPKSSVRALLRNCYFGDNQKIRLTSESFNVSRQAAYLRLCDLSYIQRTNIQQLTLL